MKTNCNRREFLKTLSVTFASIATLSVFGANAQEKKKKKKESDEKKEVLADPNKGKAKQFKYVHNRDEVKDATLKVEKMGVPFEKQSCKNCALYQPKGNGQGVCTLMLPEPEHLVKEGGWCMSWAKNPAVPV